ncbi:YggS family pyridoxal phosphate-dependent enzyme [Congregibacter litoralis]|uniref:Pyridoxal phosphate homeostasis protein n=1 Tax=Congregibacter litoralis KT71 TaxID=314285 RepID=A4A9D6_9GAMM|nr:YggS family pyridoxal phosphate-dependent enzyme [Congregibacter litoralis]EAQ97678.1 pyridoxal phosphate enzyme, YggS family [Congregibacter litoralis KT71]
MDNDLIAANIAKVLQQVSSAQEKYQRPPDSVRVMAVSKTQSAEAVRDAAAAGLTDFGENYLQEALEKIKSCADLALTWHFIGPIQSNKTRAIAEHFDWVHSVDREKILRRLSEQRDPSMAPLNLCIQVNVSGEDSKSGITPRQLAPILALATQLPNIRLRGLMAIPAPAEDFGAQKAACDSLASLFEDARKEHPTLDTLSIGMSADLEAAVAAGSTMVRIGTAIFGARR